MSAVDCIFRYTCVSAAALVSLAGALHAQTAPPKAPATPAAPGAPATPAAAPATPAAAPAAPGAPAPAPAAADPGALNLEQEMETLYSDAVTNFNVGKYDIALAKIGAIKTKVNKDFEKVIFLEGACYYNLNQYDKAAEVLEAFLTKFPKSDVLIDAKINLGRSLLKKGETDKGIKYLKEVASTSPQRKGEVGIELAEYFKAKGDIDEALNILQIVTEGAGTTPETVRGILMLAEIYASKGEADKASEAMNKLRSGSAADDTVIQINSLGLKIGDEMREAKRYAEALVAYQSVRSREEILRIQKTRVARIQEWTKDAAAGKRVYFLGRQVVKEDLASMLKANEEILGELEKNKEYDASLFFRLGQCFFEMNRYYESELGFHEVYDKFPDFKDTELALYGMIACNQVLERFGKAYKLCEEYLAKFPEGSKVTAVTEMLGILAYQSGNIEAAITALKRASTSKGADKERINFLLGVTLFEAQRFDDSRLAFQELLSEKKDSAYKDDSEYRIALTYFFQNDSKNTRKALRDYIAHNAKGGQYIVDAKYRLAFIEYQSGEIEPALAELEQLVKETPNDAAIGQVHMLRGDIYTKKADPAKALEAYLAAVNTAKTPDVLAMALDAATDLLQADGKWDQLVSIWQTYYTTHKDGPTAMKAIYQIAMGMKRGGKLEEAQKFIADAVRPVLGDPKNDQVEMLIQQMVAMMVPKKRGKAASTHKPAAAAPAEGAPADAAAKPAEPKPEDPAATAEVKKVVAPTVTYEELETKLKKLLIPDGEASLTSGAAQARLLYARSLLARYMKDLSKYENLMSIIPDAAKPEELSAMLLADLADMLRKKGQPEKAEEYYNRLREAFATSDYGDRAPVGLGEIMFERKDYGKALELFSEAIEKYPGSSSLLDATLGKAKSLMASNKLEQAEKIYNTILNTREWRSAAPIALYNLGQVYEKRKEWGKAITYYTRVILAHQKYKDWLAKSYLQATKCWMSDGKPNEAKTMVQEMLRRTDIVDQPEFAEAQGLLAKIASTQ